MQSSEGAILPSEGTLLGTPLTLLRILRSGNMPLCRPPKAVPPSKDILQPVGQYVTINVSCHPQKFFHILLRRYVTLQTCHTAPRVDDTTFQEYRTRKKARPRRFPKARYHLPKICCHHLVKMTPSLVKSLPKSPGSEVLTWDQIFNWLSRSPDTYFDASSLEKCDREMRLFFRCLCWIRR